MYAQLPNQTFPSAISARESSLDRRASPVGTLLSVALIVVLAGVLGYQLMPQARARVAPTTVAHPATPMPPTATPVSPTLTARPTDTSVPTPTPTPQKHTLEIPVVVNGRTFVIHRVTGGQTFEVLAALYTTSPAVIRALNYQLKPTLWANTQIIVSPGLKDVDPDLPAFQPYQARDATTLDDLASSLNVDVSLMRLYNRCPQGCLLAAGDWVIVPRGMSR